MSDLPNGGSDQIFSPLSTRFILNESACSCNSLGEWEAHFTEPQASGQVGRAAATRGWEGYSRRYSRTVLERVQSLAWTLREGLSAVCLDARRLDLVPVIRAELPGQDQNGQVGMFP